MPTYLYNCVDCGLELDVKHGFEEIYDEPCEGCGGVVKKNFGTVRLSNDALPMRKAIKHIDIRL